METSHFKKNWKSYVVALILVGSNIGTYFLTPEITDTTKDTLAMVNNACLIATQNNTDLCTRITTLATSD